MTLSVQIQDLIMRASRFDFTLFQSLVNIQDIKVIFSQNVHNIG